MIGTFDWSEFFESVSLVEQVLQRDPAAVYARMDFRSRDRYRHAVEELAAPTGDGQFLLALKAVECARQAHAKAPDSRASHVGYHLIGGGRREFERRVAWRPTLGQRIRRAFFAGATPLYLGSIAAGTGLMVAAAVAYAASNGWTGASLLLVALLTLVPASEVAIQLLQRVISYLIPPRRLPRLELDAVPASARTMVIVPTLFDSVQRVNDLLAHLEVQALGNLDPHVHFAVLSDFRDAENETSPHDQEILDAARAGIAALNAKHADGGSRFFLFHRFRQWNAREGLWMGWERKRGKIEEFNRLLRGATDTSFSVMVGDLSVLPDVKYCITLDSDTRLPRGVARELIGIITHPLNRPTFDAAVGRVTEGYGILQPRISVTFMSAAGSLFARLYSGHTGVDPYTSAVSDTYQDLFGEGIFTGKGLYDVDAFIASLEDTVPENALLSHDLFEGLHARVALVTDVELVDDYPSSVLSHARRQHRWVRGDWQILFWLFPLVPSRRGLKRNTLAAIGRWKILDNLRRSLVAPTLLVMLVAGWLLLPGSPYRLDVRGRCRRRFAAAPDRRQPADWSASFAIVPGILREPASRCRHDAGTGGPEPDVPRVPRLRFRARDCADARSPRRDEAPSARMGDSGGHCGEGRGAGPHGRPASLHGRNGRQPGRRCRGADGDDRLAPGCDSRGIADPPVVGDGSGNRLLAERPGRRARAPARRRPSRHAAAHGAQDVAVLRHIRH